MKKLSFASGVAAIALAAASIFPAAGVFANAVASADYTNNPITLSRTVSGVTNKVTNTFGYKITSTTKPDGATVTGAPTSASIVFNSQSVTDGAATKTTTVDFSAANYSKVGDYTFTITEDSSTDSTNYPIDAEHNDYKAIVQVRYYTDPTTHVPDNERYVATIYIKDKNDDKVTSGVATWGNAAARTYIEVAANTTGNMAEKDQCFAYTIDIATGVGGVATGDTFTIDSSTTCAGSAESVTAGTPATVYLKHDESLTVGVNNGANELPVGARYTITKTNASDYYIEKMDGEDASTVTKTTVAVPATGDSTAQAAFDTNNHTDIENNWQADPLTGIVTNFWFYLVLLIVGAFGIIVFMRKKQDDEEQQQQQQA
ncbi:MAG: hypothetical protein K6F57_04095 [Candidatus Saccharibacteria bacterium]|nr:hypothetical protein [Candidatus Saccharibacteria bacterium]